MSLINHPGSCHQMAVIGIDAGHARDIMLMLTDAHAVLDHLYLDGTQPQITSPAEDYLRESASPYSLPALIDALGEVTDQLSRAERQALDSIPPRPARMRTSRQQSCRQLLTRRKSRPEGGARSKENSNPGATECGAK